MSAFVLNRGYELQLPSSYVDIERDEMEYVDGGNATTFKNNMLYLYKNVSAVKRALNIGGITTTTIVTMGTYSLGYAITMCAGILGTTGSVLGPIVGVAGAVGGTLAVIILWNKDITK